MGENAANLPKVLGIVGETLHRELIQEDTPLYLRLVNIVKQVQVGCAPFIFSHHLFLFLILYVVFHLSDITYT